MCNFLSVTTNRLKSCVANITYGINCENHLSLYRSVFTGDSVTIIVRNAIDTINIGLREYCFDIVASNGSMTVVIKGKFTMVNDMSKHHYNFDPLGYALCICLYTEAVVAAMMIIVLFLVSIMLLLAFLLGIIIAKKSRHRYTQSIEPYVVY